MHPDLKSLRAYASAIDELKNEPIIGPQLDAMVGTSISLTRIRPDAIINRLIAVMATPDAKTVRFDSARLAAKLEDIRASLAEPTLDATALVLLPRLIADTFPIDISSTISIDYLSEQEKHQCLSLGLLREDHSFMGPGLVDPQDFVGMRIRFQLERIVLPLNSASLAGRESATIPDSRSFGDRNPSRLDLILEDALIALRLLKPGFVRCPGGLVTHTE
jgi:hypothetical protein